MAKLQTPNGSWGMVQIQPNDGCDLHH